MTNSLNASIDLHTHRTFRTAEAIPAVSALSASIRLVLAVALIITNIGRSIFYSINSCSLPSENELEGEFNTLITKEMALERASDALKAVGYNCAMIGDAIITAIPVIGNIQSWVWLARDFNQEELLIIS